MILARRNAADSNALTMLHSTVVHHGKELRDTLTSGLGAVQASHASAQRETAKAVTDELSRMRGDLRETRNSVTNSKGELSREVHTVLSGLNAEVRRLAESVQDRQPVVPAAPPAEAPIARPGSAHATDGSLPPGPVEDEGPVEPAGCSAAQDAAPAEEFATALRQALAPMRESLTDLADDVAAIRAHLHAALPSTGSVVQDGTASGQDREAHRDLLRRAAQISHAWLVCHRDSWEFVTGQAGRHPHFRMPSRISDRGEDRIAAAVSGRSLIAVLISLQETRHAAGDDFDGDWALADTLYSRIGGGLTTLAPGGDSVTITLDDRTPVDEPPAPAAPAAPAEHPEEPDAGDTPGTSPGGTATGTATPDDPDDPDDPDGSAG